MESWCAHSSHQRDDNHAHLPVDGQEWCHAPTGHVLNTGRFHDGDCRLRQGGRWNDSPFGWCYGGSSAKRYSFIAWVRSDGRTKIARIVAGLALQVALAPDGTLWIQGGDLLHPKTAVLTLFDQAAKGIGSYVLQDTSFAAEFFTLRPTAQGVSLYSALEQRLVEISSDGRPTLDTPAPLSATHVTGFAATNDGELFLSTELHSADKISRFNRLIQQWETLNQSAERSFSVLYGIEGHDLVMNDGRVIRFSNGC